jgi:Dolichyl-phosphate-mannose-protein mannosyltransferase
MISRTRVAQNLPLSAAGLGRAARLIAPVLREFAAVAREYLRLDLPIAAMVIALALVLLPTLPRSADNPYMLEAFVDDEVWQTLALDGTLHWPYGNPGNFLDPSRRAYQQIPAYWEQIRYPGIFYYGGAMYWLATPLYAAARAFGAPPFPTAPIILRVVTVATALLALIFLYNFARRYACRAAGIMAVLVVAADPFFLYYTVYPHPDQLQVLLGLFALTLAIRHVESGGMHSICALGLACGAVQGTKLGGAWTVPMAALALWWGLQSTRINLGQEIAIRLVVLVVAALAGWIITTPYGFMDPYYLKRVAAQLLVQGPSAGVEPFGHLTLWSWLIKVCDYVTPVGLVLTALALARIVLRIDIGARFRPLVLALVLCASQILIYGSGKYWIVLGYLLLAGGLITVLACDLLVAAVRRGAALLVWWAGEPRRIANTLSGVVLVTAFLILYVPYVLAAVSSIFDAALYRSSTQLALNRWAIANIGRDQRILFDAYAYFDRQWFSDVIRSPVPKWRQIAAINPDYLVLSSGIYASEHYAKLIKEQARTRDDTDPYSVRVYQDLLIADTLGPTEVAGVEHIANIEPVEWTTENRLPSLPIAGPAWLSNRIAESEALLGLVVAKAAAIWTPPDKPMTGMTYRVYHFNRIAAP